MKNFKDKLLLKYITSKSQLSPELKKSFKSSFAIISLGLVLLGLSILSKHTFIGGLSLTAGVSMFTMNLVFWDN